MSRIASNLFTSGSSHRSYFSCGTMTGIRSCRSATREFGPVVKTVQLSMISPSGQPRHSRNGCTMRPVPKSAKEIPNENELGDRGQCDLVHQFSSEISNRAVLQKSRRTYGHIELNSGPVFQSSWRKHHDSNACLLRVSRGGGPADRRVPLRRSEHAERTRYQHSVRVQFAEETLFHRPRSAPLGDGHDARENTLPQGQ